MNRVLTSVLVAASVSVFASGPRTADDPALADPHVTVVRTPQGGLQPQVAVDASGAVHLVYFEGDATHGDLFYVRMDAASGRFSAPIQVNTQRHSATATGSMRGAQLAIGRGGRVHVAWPGSDAATSRAPGGQTPVLYTRMNDAGSAFEPERNLVRVSQSIDGGGIAADASGHVYVAWHALLPHGKDEQDRRLWVARSLDDGRSFDEDRPASQAANGACGCCGVNALADRRGTLYILFRSARDVVHRDTYLLTSRDAGTTFSSDAIQAWNIGACPMSTFALTESGQDVLAAWETDGQVQWLRIDQATGIRSDWTVPAGPATTRKHPAIAGNASGETLLAWTEDTSWNKGGSLAWQRFNRDGTPASAVARHPGVPAWGLVAVAPRPDGGFTILY